ncbi:DUF2933 domain-containing protein [Streptomyces sp. NPDC058614]|uniref:DUF2933 domain-containing protein n=1 Tax=Streptomyces sp. NPDC058614 TaxID=3346557 RepID=UPI0036598056
MCINKKVLIGLGALAAGVLIFKPNLFLAALPVLVLAICPLSMVFMMRGMNNGQGRGGTSCGSGSKAKTGSTSGASEPELAEQIDTLHAELRDLKAAQAREGSTAGDIGDEAVHLTKRTRAASSR